MTIPFANRNPALIGMSGLLTSVKYPTGGRDSIEYEPNYFKGVRYPSYAVVDSVFAMYRVKRVITQSGNSPDMIKRYKYDVFNKTNDQILFTDSSSLHTASFAGKVAMGVHVCTGAGNGQHNFYQNMGGINDYPVYTIRDKPIVSTNVYGGLPYAYMYVTEFLDEAQTSFIASEFGVSQNEVPARDLSGYYYPSLSLVGAERDNLAWNNGLELKRYMGAKVANQYLIDKENRWKYNNTAQRYVNYAASKACEFYQYSTIDLERQFCSYIVKRYDLYRHWTKLDSLNEVNYFRANGAYTTIATQVKYRYSSLDKQIEEEETKDSNQDILLRQIFRPAKMVNIAQDPTGVYQAMVDAHVISPEIKAIRSTNGSQTDMVLTSYHQPFTGMFLPLSISTQRRADDPLRIRLRFLRYDAFGNVLSLAKENGTPLNFVYSYKNKYPVFKIVGATYSEIENLLTPAEIVSFSDDNALYRFEFDTRIKGYRNLFKTSLPKAQIIEYRHSPGIGLTDEINVRGRMLSYTYDYFRRLMTIGDVDGLIEMYEYHYKTN